LSFYDEETNTTNLIGENKANTSEVWITWSQREVFGGEGDLWGLDYLMAEVFEYERFGVYYEVVDAGKDGFEAVMFDLQLTVFWEMPEDCHHSNLTLTSGWTESGTPTWVSSNFPNLIGFYGFELPWMSNIDRIEYWGRMRATLDAKRSVPSGPGWRDIKYGLGLWNEVFLFFFSTSI